LVGDDMSSSEENGLNVVACARANQSTAERDVSALQAFKDVLRGLVLAESVLENDSLDYGEFYNDLRGAVDSATFTAPAESGVFVASVLDGRGLSFEAIALMGLSEGEFPKQEREDILLRESDRAALGLESKLHGDEGTLFYQAVTRGRQKLLLTRTYLAEDGQAWEASPFWAEINRLVGNQPTVRVRGDVWELDSAEAASKVEWVESVQDFDIHIKNGIEVLRARVNPKAGGIYEGQLFDLSERFGAAHGWSASRLESYGTCPFEFFVAYGLELEPREEALRCADARLDAAQNFGGALRRRYVEDGGAKSFCGCARRVWIPSNRVVGSATGGVDPRVGKNGGGVERGVAGIHAAHDGGAFWDGESIAGVEDFGGRCAPARLH
jgi:hypothetical protein